tara:strand:+ start:1149 stop:1283 length:135 start_codon:yes stop_codon:yes gene_type:complete
MLYSVGLLSLAFQGGAAFSAAGASKLGASAVAGPTGRALAVAGA